MSDRCELNRQIRVDNALIRTLKATIAKLKKAVESTIPAIAAAMESIRQNIIMFNYGLLFVPDRRKDTKEYVEQATRQYSDYKDIRRQIKAKERSKLQKEFAGLSVFAIDRRKELESRIAARSEEIEELQFEKESIMRAFDKADAAGMRKVEGEISKPKARIVKLDAQKVEFTGAINHEKEKFDGLKAQAADLDQDKLTDTRLALHTQLENEGCERIRKDTSDGRISFTKYQATVRDTDRALGEDRTVKRYQEQTHNKERKKDFHHQKRTNQDR